MNIFDKLAEVGIVPVVVLDNRVNAIPTAKALLDGGIDVMEITFRTEAAADAIRAVSEELPEMTVGAGTIVTLDQCKRAIESGAKFIVSPGFDEEVVKYCVENNILIVPGCVTPSEIMKAMKYGLKVVKFFPAGVYGGLSALKALSGPFTDIKFIPTGGVNTQNIGEFSKAPFVYAVGGSWVCPKVEIEAGNFEKISVLCKEAKKAALGYEVAHIGIYAENSDNAKRIYNALSNAFGFEIKEGTSSCFASSQIEIMSAPYLGWNGHIAIRTNSIEMAMADLRKKGYKCDENTRKYKGNKLIAVYLEGELGNFGIHLLQR